MKPIITIDGIDGSGKSTYARSVVEMLTEAGEHPVLFRVDDFRSPVTWTTPEREADQYHDSYYDLARCDACLGAFVEGAACVSIPIYDNVAERVTGDHALDLAGATVAVIEGVFPLRMPRVTGSVVIYLQVSEDEARRRIVARDLAKGRSADEITRRIDRRYFPSQRRYHRELHPEDRADIVIDNEVPTRPRVLRCDLTRAPHSLQRALREPARPGPRLYERAGS
ncbi:MAG: uridine kinase [Kofleriaceae bacterium]